MLFLDDKPKFKTKNTKRQLGSLVCLACQKPIESGDSVMSGMGPICLERTRFAEIVDRSHLPEIEGARESILKGLYPARTAILNLKNEKNPRYVTVLSVEHLESIVIDRTEMNKAYQETGSMKDAILASLYAFSPMDGSSIAPISNPKHPEVMRQYKKFQKEIRGIYKERAEYLLKHPHTAYYNQVQSKKTLNPEQTKNREELLSKKDLEPDYFNKHWSSGAFHKATFITRLQFTKLSEARVLALALNKNLDIKTLDYGLTDQEISSGLQHSGQLFEKNLFQSFISGNKNLMFLIEIYKKIDSFEGSDKLFFVRLSNLLNTKTEFKDIEKLEELLQKYKISSAFFVKP